MNRKKRGARYLPLKRRSARAELVIDAISKDAAVQIQEIFVSHFKKKGHVQPRMDELSDKIYRVRNNYTNAGKLPSVEHQRESLGTLQSAFTEILETLDRDSETRKRVYLSFGDEEKTGRKRFRLGQKRILAWKNEFAEALDFATIRLPEVKSGSKLMFPYERWLINELAAIWHEETGKPISVAEDPSLGRTGKRRKTKATEIRRVFELALSETNANLSGEQITRYMNEARKENPYLSPPTEDDEASDDADAG